MNATEYAQFIGLGYGFYVLSWSFSLAYRAVRGTLSIKFSD